MLDDFKVSIIVPCFNQAIYLPDALDSVLSQTYSNWECIIVDDGSSDNTKEVSKEYLNQDNRFYYIYQENAGLSAARNTGIKNSSGEYILPLDSDDKISPSYLEDSVPILQNNSDIKIVYCNAEYFGEKHGLWEVPDFSLSQILLGNMIVCTSLYRRSDYEKTTGYNSQMIYGWEDWDLWLSILETGGTAYRIPKANFFYRIRSGSMVRSLTDEQVQYLKNKIYLNHVSLYSKAFGSFIDICRINQIALEFKKNPSIYLFIKLMKNLLFKIQ